MFITFRWLQLVVACSNDFDPKQFIEIKEIHILQY